jgi:uncharacterized membrane protein
VETSNRIPAFLAYLLLIVGCLYIFIFQRKDEFAVFHAKQSLLIMLTALLAPLVWAVAAWLMSWLPFGFALAIALFSLVVATYLLLVGLWLLGMLYVSQSQAKPLPFIGGWAKWIPID